MNVRRFAAPLALVLFVATDAQRSAMHDGGLRDIAPTLLTLLGLPIPARMTGRALLERRA